MEQLTKNKVAIVTGGTQGIGRAIVEKLANEGVKVIVNFLKSIDAAMELKQKYAHVDYYQGDITNAAHCEKLITHTLETFGQIDFLINNAALSVRIPHQQIELITDALFQDFFNMNLLAPWRLCRLAAPHLNKSTNGNIIMLSSIAGIRPMGSSIAYGVTKAGLNHMTLLLAKALAPHIRVNAIAPGFVETNRTKDWHDVKQSMQQHTPLARSGTPQEIAEVAWQILNNTFTTGTIAVVDGGFGIQN